ncbi:MAG TPA: 6-hydroxynicotinate reductase, partial [Burkholderiaceae bacterium]
MNEHTKTDGLPETLQVLERSRPRSERMATDKIECNACPVLCQISPGKTGACDRYANAHGTLIRVDPVVLLRRTLAGGDA